MTDEISIHAPRVGSDLSGLTNSLEDEDFNPRSPCGERPWIPVTIRRSNNFNPRSPCGERLGVHQTTIQNWKFQSTLPVWGATPDEKAQELIQEFQSTLPVWGATRWSICGPMTPAISIHAPRVGSDNKTFWLAATCCTFQSTLPVWGATAPTGDGHQRSGISIHAPRVGSDSKTAQILLEILSHLNSFAPSEKKKIPFHRKEQGKFIEIF